MYLTKKLEKMFIEKFKTKDINRVPMTVLNNKNIHSVTTIDDPFSSAILIRPKKEKIIPFKNEASIKKSAVQRTFIDKKTADNMVKNPTYALQATVLYLNNALYELTNILGSEVVTNRKNELIIEFHNAPEDTTKTFVVEMRTYIKIA